MPTARNDFGDFARRIRARAQQIDRKINRTVAQTAGLVLSVVVPATPVDTGRARGNWQVSVGEPILRPINREDKTGAGTIARGQAEADKRRSGQAIYISNNVPYIGRLNDGYSKQAPAQFVERAVAEAVKYIRNARVVG